MSRSIDIGKMKAKLDPRSGFITLSSSDKDSPLRQNGVLFNVSPGTQRYDILKEMIEETSEEENVFTTGQNEKLPKVVYLGDKYRSKDSTTVPLGIGTDRRTLYWDTKTAAHLVVTGQTGSGKTTVLQSIVDHVNTHRKDTRAIYCNPSLYNEVIRFENFKNVHENIQFVETGDSESTISRVQEMMVERYNYLEEIGLEDIEPGIRIGDFKRVFFMIDELKKYPHNDPSRASQMLKDVLNRGGRVGIHVAVIVYGTYEQAREYFPDAPAVITTQRVEGEGVTESVFRATGDDTKPKRMKVFAIQR